MASGSSTGVLDVDLTTENSRLREEMRSLLLRLGNALQHNQAADVTRLQLLEELQRASVKREEADNARRLADIDLLTLRKQLLDCGASKRQVCYKRHCD